MNALSQYIRKGKLSVPFAPTEKAERALEQAQRLHDYVQEVVAKASPLSPELGVEIAEILRPAVDRRRPSVMRWRAWRFCGDVVEQEAAERCPACGMDPARIVGAEPIELVGSDQANPLLGAGTLA